VTDDQTEADIQAKGLTAARVTPGNIEAAIHSEHYFSPAHAYSIGDTHSTVKEEDDIGRFAYTAMTRLTFCVLVLRNGYTVTGESACVSPENFDAELGRKIARQNAIDKCWPLFGFALACERAKQ
jgi:hypothetical protein